MISIRRVHGTTLPAERDVIGRVQEIFRQNFPDVAAYAEKIPVMLERPLEKGYESFLLVSETLMNMVTGFSLFLHFPEVNSSFLDFLAVRREIRSGGFGGALYEATREFLSLRGSRGLYMEVLPADPAVIQDPAVRKENQRRLRFYARYDVWPIANTAYETPVGDSPAPQLLFDGLGRTEPLGRAECRAAMRIILTRKYSSLVTPDYIERVVESVIDDPVVLRKPARAKVVPSPVPVRPGRLSKPFCLVVTDGHTIHHVRDRGYVERPARVDVLKETVLATGLFEGVKPHHFGEKPIRAVHDGRFVTYLDDVCKKLSAKRPVYPYVFPIRRPERRPKDLAVRAGYYCIDTFTPLDRNAYQAARSAVDVAMTAADQVLAGRRVAYALCRPPGHHAERSVFGGFCYFNNAAIAAHHFSKHGKVAVLDIDYHHGNGTQDIFYARPDVLTISLHGHPNDTYPYFSGFADELGEGPGRGYNRNFPLKAGVTEHDYLSTLERAVEQVKRFRPIFLVVSLGFDIMRGDPTGSCNLSQESMHRAGALIGSLSLPTLVIQEGGYNLRNLRRGSVSFFAGMAEQALERLAAAPAKRKTP